jgi:hypothetical protein
MDKFEKYVTDHHDEFDVYEPAPEFWNKINRPKVLHTSRNSWFWKAAVILLVFGASFWANTLIINTKHVALKHDSAPSDVPKIVEAEKYYSGLIQTKINAMQKVLTSYPELKSDLHRDFAELDSAYRDMKKDLKDNVSNQEVIEAMIQNYRLKLKLLEQIQQELQNQSNKHEKPRSHEM